MQIEFFNARDLKNIKATVHSTGRLGFSRGAEEKLRLKTAKAVRIGRGQNYEVEKDLYLVTELSATSNSFLIGKSGPYFYANTRDLFKMLGEDFENKKIIFDIESETVEGQPVFKLKRRIIERKKGVQNIE